MTQVHLGILVVWFVLMTKNTFRGNRLKFLSSNPNYFTTELNLALNSSGIHRNLYFSEQKLVMRNQPLPLKNQYIYLLNHKWSNSLILEEVRVLFQHPASWELCKRSPPLFSCQASFQRDTYNWIYLPKHLHMVKLSDLLRISSKYKKHEILLYTQKIVNQKLISSPSAWV